MDSEKQIHRIFSLFDHDNDGHIANRELSTVLRLLGRNPTNEEILTLTKKMDPLDENKISYESFMSVYSQPDILNEGSPDELKNALKIFDKDGTGYFTVSEFRHIMLQLGERFTDEEFQDIMRDGNFERNGKIWIDEFVASIQSK